MSSKVAPDRKTPAPGTSGKLFRGAKVLIPYPDETEEEREQRILQEAEIEEYREEKRRNKEQNENSKHGPPASPPPPSAPKPEHIKDEDLAEIVISTDRWKRVIEQRMLSRRGFHCVFQIIREEYEDAVNDLMAYFKAEAGKIISPFKKYKWMERFLTTLCFLANTKSKADRKILPLHNNTLETLKYDDATILAEALQTYLRREWNHKKAVEAWLDNYTIIKELCDQNEGIHFLILQVAAYLKLELQLRYGLHVKLLLFLFFVYFAVGPPVWNSCGICTGFK